MQIRQSIQRIQYGSRGKKALVIVEVKIPREIGRTRLAARGTFRTHPRLLQCRTPGSVAQLVERGIHKPKVPGSNPGAAISHFK